MANEFPSEKAPFLSDPRDAEFLRAPSDASFSNTAFVLWSKLLSSFEGYD